tara:strand:- start:305 stop:457 length:153 start_codon:yes stop_codon:yes gene_type:complete
MTNQDVQRAKYREIEVGSSKPSFNALSDSKKNQMRTIVNNFFGYIKDKHT